MAIPEILHPHVAAFRNGLDRPDVAVLIHGWTGSPAHFRPIAEGLVAAGIGVVAPLLAGHGTHVTDMIDTGWRDWMASAAGAAQEATEAGARIHFAGLSMGGLLGLLLANAFDATSVTTINSPVFVYDRRLRFSFLRRGSRTIDVYPPDEWPAGFATEYARQYDSTPIGTVAELHDIMRAAKRHLPLVSAPALVVQSQTDETVRPESGSYIYDHLGSVTKRMLWLDRSRHVATLDTERTTILTELVAHIEASVRIAAGQAS